jgi:hypothetical protein
MRSARGYGAATAISNGMIEDSGTASSTLWGEGGVLVFASEDPPARVGPFT